MNKFLIAALSIIAILFLITILAYPYLPAKIASHWNFRGEVDNYMSKFWGLFLIPLITLVLFLLFFLIPIIDPLKENIKKFKTAYYSFVLILILFMFYIQSWILLWNFGYHIDMSLTLIPAIGFLFIYIGFILEKTKRNWFIGIRTPWTLSSDKVWNKTHKLGSLLFKISGLITFIGIFFGNYMLWFVLAPIIISSIWLIIYSYLEYKKEKKK